MRKVAFILSCLPALAFCQWPGSGVRFNGPANGPDSGAKIAVILLLHRRVFQTSQDLDFLTLAKTQSVTSFSPGSYSVSAGTGSGSLGNLSVLSTIGGSRATATVDFTASMPESDPTEPSISVSGSTDYLVTEVIFVWDNLTAGWLEVARKNSGISGDLTTIFPLKDDPRRFIDGSGNVKIRVSYVGSNQQFTAHLGSVGWKVLGN